MNINKIDNNNNPSFGKVLKMRGAAEHLRKTAKELGTTPEMLVGSTSVGGLSSSAGLLATGNYSGLAKFLPINISIPLGTGIFSSVAYKLFVNSAKNAAEQEAKEAKSRGEEVPEQTDPDFIKAIFIDIKNRLKNLGKVDKN